MKLIQSGSVHVKLFRKRLSKKIPVYLNDVKCGLFKRGGFDRMYYEIDDYVDFQEHVADFLKVIRDVSLYGGEYIHIHYTALLFRKSYTDDVITYLSDNVFYVPFTKDELIKLHELTNTPIEINANPHKYSTDKASLYAGVPYIIHAAYNNSINVAVYGGLREAEHEIDLSNSVMKLSYCQRFCTRFAHPYKISFYNHMKDENNVVLFKLPSVELEEQAPNRNIELVVSNNLLLDVDALKSFLDKVAQHRVYVFINIYDVFLGVFENEDEDKNLNSIKEKTFKNISFDNYVQKMIETYKLLCEYEQSIKVVSDGPYQYGVEDSRHITHYERALTRFISYQNDENLKAFFG